jgi:hypothetical protein
MAEQVRRTVSSVPQQHRHAAVRPNTPNIAASIDAASSGAYLGFVLDEPLQPTAARALIRDILANGSVTFSKHAREEMEKDKLTFVDVTNVLRGGVVDPAELENGSWRYRVRTARIAVIVAFRSETELRVVTAWRIGS